MKLSSSKIINHIRKQDWSGFVMNMLAVILGIVITFKGEDIISDNQTQKDVKASLQLVYDELDGNLQTIQYADSLDGVEFQALTFLSKYIGHYEDAPADSLRLYCNVPLYADKYQVSHHALDLLKSSSIFSKITDKTLAYDIIRAYSYFDGVFEAKNTYSDMKVELLKPVETDEFKKMINKGSGHFGPVEFWTVFTASVDGKHFLQELTIKHRLRIREENTHHQIIDVLDRIHEYCEK